MQPIQGRTWVFGDNMNSNLFLQNGASDLALPEAAKLMFSANRPGWADEVEQGDIIIAGRDFGTGSARHVSPLMRELGITAIVADSFASVAFRGFMNAGFPALTCPGATSAVEEGQRVEVDVVRGTLRNLDTGAELQGKPLPPPLLELLTGGGLFPSLEKRGLLQDKLPA